jgi:hypothetical protein
VGGGLIQRLWDRRQDDGTQTKRVKTLAMLGFILVLVVFSPTLKGWLGSLFRPKVVRLENTEMVIPKGWLVSQEPAKVSAWKPCWTIFCGIASRASFMVKLSGLPAAAWENATKKILEEDFSTDVAVKTFYGSSGPFTCVEADVVLENRKVVTACLISNPGLNCTFVGDPSLRDVYLDVLKSAQPVR